MLRLLPIWLACGSLLSGMGCGGSRSSTSVENSEDSTSLLSAAAPADIVVAEVAGVPIYGSCVRQQVQHLQVSRAEALEQCIEFELLAQEAQRRGLQRDPDVREAGRKEAVRALLTREIVTPMPSVAGTDRSVLEDAYKRYRNKIYAPERRRIFHLFAPFPQKREAPGSAADRAARAFADELYAALADGRDMDPADVYRTARQVAGERQLGPVDDETGAFKYETFKVFRNKPDLPHGFSHAAMDIPEPGMVSPPARSDYGWHIILYLSREPAKYADVDQAAEYLFQAVRSERFWSFTSELLKAGDIAVDETALERMQAAAEALAESATEAEETPR